MEKRYYSAEFSVCAALLQRIKYLESMRDEIQKEYAKMPKGSLLVAPGTTSTSFRYYLREETTDKMGTYLNLAQEKTKKKYATKKYYSKLLKEIDNEMVKLKKMISTNSEDSIISTFKKLNPGITKLIAPINIDNETFIKMWLAEEYEGLGFDINDKTSLYSDRNERMRSKSEVLIANALNRRNIPYKYECPLELSNGQKLYPDFTILDVKNRKVKYWEHLGKMGDMAYVARNIWKLDEYKKQNIRLGINLYVTYENGINAIGKEDIEGTIEAIVGSAIKWQAICGN